MIESFWWRKFLVRTGLVRWMPSTLRQLHGCDKNLHRMADRALALPLRELADPALFPDLQTPDSIHLARSAPRFDRHFGMPRITAESAGRDPQGSPELCAEIAVRFQLDHGPEHDPQREVLVTHGGTGAWSAVLDTFVNPGDRAVVFEPCSPMLMIGLKHRRASIVRIPTTAEAGRLRFAIDPLSSMFRDAKLFVFADPDQPRGCTIAPEDLEQLTYWAAKHDVLMIQDVSLDRWRDAPAAARTAGLPGAQGRLISINSMAVSHGLSSVRIGWAVGDRRLVQPMTAVSAMSAPPVSALDQQYVLNVIRTGERTLQTLQDDLKERRRYAWDRLRTFGLSPESASAGYGLWAPVPDAASAAVYAQKLLSETGVLVGPGGPYARNGDQFIRISCAIEEGRLREGLSRWERFASGVGPTAHRSTRVEPVTSSGSSL